MTAVRNLGRFHTHDQPSMGWAGESRMRREDEEEPETIEIHNHIPTDYGQLTSEEMDARNRDGEPDIEDPDEELVEVLPEDLYARETEDGRTAIYRRHGHRDARRSAEAENLAMDRRRKQARDTRPPETLAELNKLHHAFYAKSHAVR